MNHDLQKCREHYESLFPADRHRPTAACLLTAIQIADKYETALTKIGDILNADNAGSHRCDDPEGAMDRCHGVANNALARVTKTEGE